MMILILCTDKDSVTAECALGGLENNAAYRLKFTNTVGKGKQTYCFVSSDEKTVAGRNMDAVSLNSLNTFYTSGSNYLRASLSVKDNKIAIERK